MARTHAVSASGSRKVAADRWLSRTTTQQAADQPEHAAEQASDQWYARDNLHRPIGRDVAYIRILSHRGDAAQLHAGDQRRDDRELLVAGVGAAEQPAEQVAEEARTGRLNLLDDDAHDPRGIDLRLRLQQRVDLQGRVENDRRGWERACSDPGL